MPKPKLMTRKVDREQEDNNTNTSDNTSSNNTSDNNNAQVANQTNVIDDQTTAQSKNRFGRANT